MRRLFLAVAMAAQTGCAGSEPPGVDAAVDAASAREAGAADATSIEAVMDAGSFDAPNADIGYDGGEDGGALMDAMVDAGPGAPQGLRATICANTSSTPLQQLPRAEVVATAGEIDGAARDFSFLEGPVWLPSQGILRFTDFNNGSSIDDDLGPPSIIYELRPDDSIVASFPEASVRSNGMAVDEDGSMVVAAHDAREIARVDPQSGARSTVVGQYQGATFNAPNDLVVSSQGHVYFTDPAYNGQVDGRPRDLSFEGVFHFDGTEARLIDDTISRPNGITLSVDESWLFVASRGDNDVYRYPVAADGAVGPRELFIDGASADGVAIDCAGNLYLAIPNRGITVYRPDGSRIGVIAGARAVTNVAFGGPDHRTLFITERQRLLSVQLPLRGLPY